MATMGSFGGAGLGMGVAFSLEDHFTRTSQQIEQSLGKLDAKTEIVSQRINKSMDRIKLGMGMATVGAAILAPFVMGVKAASDAQEISSKFGVVFQDVSKEAEAMANSLDKNYGLASSTAKQLLSDTGDMLTGFGMGGDMALDLSGKVNKLAVDLASFTNYSGGAEGASKALTKALLGERESVKSLGIAIMQKDVAAKVKDLEVSGKLVGMTLRQKQAYATLEIAIAQSKNAIGDYARTKNEYANVSRRMTERTKELSEAFGAVMLPILTRVKVIVTSVVEAFKGFAESPAGKAILKVVMALGIFLVVGGLALVLINGMKFGVYKLANAFTADTKAKIINTLATKGMSAGLRQMGKAAWASIGPFALIAVAIMALFYILKKAGTMMDSTNKKVRYLGYAILFLLGPIGWLYAAYKLITKGMKMFTESSDDQLKKLASSGGLVAFFVKFAGVIKGVAAVWRSWNGQTFELTEKLRNKLKALGILDLVLKLSTWVVRVKELFSGIWEGIKEGFGVIKKIVSSVIDAFVSKVDKAREMMGGLNVNIGKNTSKLESWKKTGKIVGYVIVGMFAAIAIAATLAAISMIIAFIPVLLAIAAVVAIVWLFNAALEYLGSSAASIWNDLSAGFNLLVEDFKSAIDWILDLPAAMYDMGVSFVENLWAGIASVWDKFTDWMSNAWESVTDVFDTGTWFGDEDTEVNKTINTSVSGGTPIGNTSKIMKPMLQTASAGGSQSGAQPIIIQQVIDGEVVAEKVTSIQELNASRNM